MKLARFIIILFLCLGLVSCVQGNLDRLEIVIGPTIVPATATVQAQAEPTATLTPTPEPSRTPTPTPDITPTTPVCLPGSGRLEIKKLESEWLPEQLDYRVYTPPCYDELTDQRYPVLYLIHGYGSNDDQWERLGVAEAADQLIAAGDLSPFIVVMPHDRNHNVQPPENLFGDSLAFELVPAVDKAYRTIPSSKYRAIGGLSRGGNWAIHIGLIHWTVFGKIGAHSAPLFVTDGPSQIRSWLDQIPARSYSQVYLDIGERDKWLQHIIDFEETLDEFDVPHELFIFPGGHTEEYWSSHVEQYLRWYASDW